MSPSLLTPTLLPPCPCAHPPSHLLLYWLAHPHTSHTPSHTAAAPTASLSKLNPANLTSWGVDDVCQWLNSEGLGRFMDTFRENAVDGECLLSLDNNLLKNDLGIVALGHRSRILKRVLILKESTHPYLS